MGKAPKTQEKGFYGEVSQVQSMYRTGGRSTAGRKDGSILPLKQIKEKGPHRMKTFMQNILCSSQKHAPI
ncbi:hypothetical protein DMR_00880 [Solidesulfovibrio magneticus RS-1]|uniref:Uncharacterized protein n=1 Tax=Solidesulfovibrio magneticus (strain ATCC 700980 / DSM 13731 / RS-1) TaxID=573370 RepID=C4XTR4_SOLM1|nr:hypothetical protein DMR_00880 [Solidesulfovibrio magneticus RS-1]